MTGRARIGGLSRHQHVWAVIHAAPKPMSQRQVFEACWSLGFTMHQIDHHLRRLFEASAVRRSKERQRGQYRYVYRTIGKMPPDGRVAPVEHRLTTETAKALNAARRRARFPCSHNHDDEGDNWGGGGCARKTGTPADLPRIPTLADLLART